MAFGREPLTQEEIALAADVSIATVCRVLAGGSNVSDRSRGRVLEAREHVRHIHDTLRDTRLALIVPNSRPFFSELAFEFSRECQRIGCELGIVTSNGHSQEELKLIEFFLNRKVRGIFLVSAGTSHGSQIRELQSKRRCPIVCVDREVSDLDCVAVDGRAGTIEAVRHLHQSGHERIGYIRGLSTSNTAEQRYTAFRQALEGEGLSYEPAWTFWGDYGGRSGEKCSRLLDGLPWQDRPTAVLAANDEMAIRLISGLQSLGWQLPKELSVVGFDGIDWGRWTEPALTTMRQPLSRLVREALRVLSTHIDASDGVGGGTDRVVSKIPPQLLLRESVASLRTLSEPLLAVR